VSLAFTYLAIEVGSNNGNAHEVQLYVDVTGGAYMRPALVYGDEFGYSHFHFPELLSEDTSKGVINLSIAQKGEYVYHELASERPSSSSS
jgi:hypothetical protein